MRSIGICGEVVWAAADEIICVYGIKVLGRMCTCIVMKGGKKLLLDDTPDMIIQAINKELEEK